MADIRNSGVITISVDSKRFKDRMENYSRRLPIAARMGAKKIAGAYALEYLNGAIKSGIRPWTNRSFNTLRTQITNPYRVGNGYGVIVPGNLTYLDQIKIHIVYLGKNTSIGRWAKAHGIKGKFLTIHPHPWIKAANARAFKNIKLMEKELNKEIRRKN